jgi:hypothetical protein
MIRQASKVWLSAEERDELERSACSRTLPVRCVERARIILGFRMVKILERLEPAIFHRLRVNPSDLVELLKTENLAGRYL